MEDEMDGPCITHGGDKPCLQTSGPEKLKGLNSAGRVKSEETSIARQLLGKHIPTATNTQAAIE
jgi:hypothetical protein